MSSVFSRQMADTVVRMHRCASYAFSDVHDIKRILCEGEFRSLPSALSRAANLVIFGYCPPSMASEATGVPLSSVKRAVKALRENRAPGKAGRPTSLSAKSELVLVNWLAHPPHGASRPTYQDVMDEVCPHFASLLFHLSLLLMHELLLHSCDLLCYLCFSIHKPLL